MSGDSHVTRGGGKQPWVKDFALFVVPLYILYTRPTTYVRFSRDKSEAPTLSLQKVCVESGGGPVAIFTLQILPVVLLGNSVTLTLLCPEFLPLIIPHLHSKLLSDTSVWNNIQSTKTRTG